MSCKPVGKVSPSVIADWAGLVPVLVKVKTRVVVAPSAIEPAPKVLATVGLVLVTLKHWSVDVLLALVVVTLAAKLVWLACGQAPAVPAVLVRPAKVTLQVAVALAMATAVRPEMTRLPLL